jgi:hypothetical protein
MSALKIENLFGVKGYVALVTGGSSGLGFMISKVRRLPSERSTSCDPVLDSPPVIQYADMKLAGTGGEWCKSLCCCLALRTHRREGSGAQ